MPQRLTFRPPSNPLLQVLYVILGGLLLIGVIVMGAVVLAVGVGVALILAVVFYVRLLWLNRKLKRSGSSATKASSSSSSSDGKLLEAEYTVVDERDDRDSRS